MKYVTIVSSVIALFLVSAFAAPAGADECDKLTYLTFSAPVELPGIALPAGTYQFSHPNCADGDRILRVSSQDGSEVYATLLTIPDYRPASSNQTMVLFGETPAGAPEAIKAWFYPGEIVGDELIYPERKAPRI